MKSMYTCLLALLIAIPAYAQEPGEKEVPEVPEAPAPEKESSGDSVIVANRVRVIETPDRTRVSVGKNEVIIVEESGDTVVVSLGKKGISIVEGEDGVEISVMEMEDEEEVQEMMPDPEEAHHKKRKKKFKPHWAGLQIGLNSYLTPDYSQVLPPDDRFMDLNTGRSWNWNLNIADFGFGLGTQYVGLLSGVGFEFINYHFNGQNGIMKDPVSGEIVEYVPTYAGNIRKSKLNMTYLTAPLLLEFQIPVSGSKRIHLSGGVIGGLKLWSNTKIKYTQSGDRAKEKNRGDYNLSPLRWGFTGKVGYNEFYFFANYYMTPLFKSGQGPELHPFSVGIGFTSH